MNTSRARRTRLSPGTFAPVSATQRAGGQAEDRALDYLLARGLRLVERNFRLPIGELDLVMADADELVFVEVRQRASARYGGAAASVTPAKQGRMRRTAQVFLALRWGAQRWPAMRFDVVAIDGPAGACRSSSAVGSPIAGSSVVGSSVVGSSVVGASATGSSATGPSFIDSSGVDWIRGAF